MYKPLCNTILTVNPKTWYISPSPKENNPKEKYVKCCQICSLSEELKRASDPSRRNEPTKNPLADICMFD
jgi:hypothetical protein